MMQNQRDIFSKIGEDEIGTNSLDPQQSFYDDFFSSISPSWAVASIGEYSPLTLQAATGGLQDDCYHYL
jgi:hypothetical protein